MDVFGVLAASSGVLLPVGFALRPMILDLFTGLALSMEQPFRIKDWVHFHIRGVEPVNSRV